MTDQGTLFFEDEPVEQPARQPKDYTPGKPFPAEPAIPGDRFTPAINRMRKALAAGVRVDNSRPITADLARFARSMDVTALEHFHYQEVQARAHVTGRLTHDEAQVIYMALGEVGSATNGGWAAGTDLATKVIVTEVIASLTGVS